MPESRGRVLLVDLPSVSPNEINVGLAAIAGVLRQKGHDVRVLDLNSLHVPGKPMSRLAQALQWQPDVVGVSLFPACNITLDGARDALGVVRETLGDKTLRVAGGVGVSLTPVGTARKLRGLADLCVYGEGEITFAEIVEKRLGGGSLSGIPGTVRFDNDAPVQAEWRPFIKDLDALPWPAYDAFDSVGEKIAEYLGLEYQKPAEDDGGFGGGGFGGFGGGEQGGEPQAEGGEQEGGEQEGQEEAAAPAMSGGSSTDDMASAIVDALPPSADEQDVRSVVEAL